MNVFQILFSLITASAIYVLVKKRSSAAISSRTLLVWSLLWLSAEAIVLFPDLSSYIADIVGIGRGADVVLYIAIILLFLMMLKLYIKVEKVSRDITLAIRAQAISHPKTPKK